MEKSEDLSPSRPCYAIRKCKGVSDIIANSYQLALSSSKGDSLGWTGPSQSQPFQREPEVMHSQEPTLLQLLALGKKPSLILQ
jgi:hypothetical protein